MVKIEIKIGIGISADKESFKAGKEASEMAISQIKQEKADLLIVFGSPTFNQKELLMGITSVSGKTRMIGGTTAGEISTKGFTVGSVVVMALKSEDITFSIGIGKNISKNEVKAGKEVASKTLGNITKNKAKSMLLFMDGLSGDGLKVIKGIQSILGKDFEIVGGAFGDGDRFQKTYQYYNGKVYENTAVCILIAGKIRIATGVRSGWTSIGNKFICTKSKSNVVYEFNSEKALKFYENILGERSKNLPKIGVQYPFGLIDEKAKISKKEYFQLRAPLSIDRKEGSIILGASIPEGSEVTITSASRNDVIKGAKLAAEQAKRLLRGTKPKLILVFSCAARNMVLGRRTQEEIDIVKKVLGKDVPMFGFYTYSEIGPIDKTINSLKPTKWHNQTMVLWVLDSTR